MNINARIVHKHDTEENWDKATNFIPKKGEIIIYDTDANHKTPRVKIGNGHNNVKNLPFIDDEVLHAYIDESGSYFIDKPLKVKTNSTDSYFINTEGEAALAIIGYANSENDSEARLVLGNKNKANFAIRDQVMNSKDAVLNIWDYNYENGQTLLRLEPVNAFKQKAYNNHTNQSGAYVQAVVWPTDGTSPTDYTQLPTRLAKVIHENNIAEYAATEEDLEAINKRIDQIANNGFKVIIVDSLESVQNPSENIIYLVGPKADNTYDEFLYLSTKKKFELIGNTAIDLSRCITVDGGVIEDANSSATLELYGDYLKQTGDTGHTTTIDSGVITTNTADDSSSVIISPADITVQNNFNLTHTNISNSAIETQGEFGSSKLTDRALIIDSIDSPEVKLKNSEWELTLGADNFDMTGTYIGSNGMKSYRSQINQDELTLYRDAEYDDGEDRFFRISSHEVSGSQDICASFKEWLSIPEESQYIFDGSISLGSLSNQTIENFRHTLENWIFNHKNIVNATANFYANAQWINQWNNEDLTTAVGTGSRWIVSVVASYSTSAYVQLMFATYSDKQIYFASCRNGVWDKIHKVIFSDDIDAITSDVAAIKNSYLPKTTSGGMYVIDTPLNVKTNKKDNYFINKSGDAALNIRSDVANGTASLNLGQNSKSKYGLRVRPNTDDPDEPPRLDIYDYTGNKSIAIIKSVDEIKTDAFENGNGDTNSGMYIGSAVWPEDKEINSASDLEYRLAKVVHEKNIGDYTVSKEQYNSDINDLKDKLENSHTTTPDWNQNDETQANYIKNRTHYEESKAAIDSDTLMWDGNSNGLIFTNSTADPESQYYLVSTEVPPFDYLHDMEISATITETNGEISKESLQVLTAELEDDVSIAWICDGLVAIVGADNLSSTYETITFPKKGIYFLKYSNSNGSIYISSLTIPNYNHFTSTITIVHTLDSKYIPGDIARKTDLEAIVNKKDIELVNDKSWSGNEGEYSVDKQKTYISTEKITISDTEEEGVLGHNTWRKMDNSTAVDVARIELSSYTGAHDLVPSNDKAILNTLGLFINNQEDHESSSSYTSSKASLEYNVGSIAYSKAELISDGSTASLTLKSGEEEQNSNTLKITATSVEGNDAAKESWKEWLEITNSTDSNIASTIDGTYALGSLKNKTITYLRSAIKSWLDKNLLFTSASAHFYANNDWIDLWNLEEVNTSLNTGSKWTVTVVAPYTTSDYVQLKISTYGDQKVYYTCCRNGQWEKVHQVAFADQVVDNVSFATEMTYLQSQMESKYIPKTDSGGMYLINTPINVKTTKQDNYFINTAGHAALNIRTDKKGCEARVTLGQEGTAKFSMRVKDNSDSDEPSRFDLFDHMGGKSSMVVKSANEVKIDAFQEYQETGKKDVNSGMYIGTAVWPEGTTPVSYTQLDYQLAKVVHERNINDYIRPHSYIIHGRIPAETMTETITIEKTWNGGTPVLKIVPTYSGFNCTATGNVLSVSDADEFVRRTGIADPAGIYNIHVGWRDASMDDYSLIIKKDEVIVYKDTAADASLSIKGLVIDEDIMWDRTAEVNTNDPNSLVLVGTLTVSPKYDWTNPSSQVFYSLMEDDDMVTIMTQKPAHIDTNRKIDYALQLDIIGNNN